MTQPAEANYSEDMSDTSSAESNPPGHQTCVPGSQRWRLSHDARDLSSDSEEEPGGQKYYLLRHEPGRLQSDCKIPKFNFPHERQKREFMRWFYRMAAVNRHFRYQLLARNMLPAEDDDTDSDMDLSSSSDSDLSSTSTDSQSRPPSPPRPVQVKICT